MKLLYWIENNVSYKKIAFFNFIFLVVISCLFYFAFPEVKGSNKLFMLMTPGVLGGFFLLDSLGVDVISDLFDTGVVRHKKDMTSTQNGILTSSCIIATTLVSLISFAKLSISSILLGAIVVPMFILATFLLISMKYRESLLNDEKKFVDVLGMEDKKFNKYYKIVKKQHEFYSKKNSGEQIRNLAQLSNVLMIEMKMIDNFDNKAYRDELVELTNSLFKVTHSKLLIINELIKEPMFIEVLKSDNKKYRKITSTYETLLVDINRILNLYKDVDQENKREKANSLFEWL